MQEAVIFSSREISEMENWNLWGKRPAEIEKQKWQLAIAGSVEEEYFIQDESFPEDMNAQKRYIKNKDIIFKALKAIEFPRHPAVRTDRHGIIYLYFGYGSDGMFTPSFTVDGYLGFFGGGNVCVIVPKTANSICIMYLRINTNSVVTKTIDIHTLEKYIVKNELIKLNLVYFPVMFTENCGSDVELISPKKEQLISGSKILFSVRTATFTKLNLMIDDILQVKETKFAKKENRIFELSFTIPENINQIIIYGEKRGCLLPLIQYKVVKKCLQ